MFGAGGCKLRGMAIKVVELHHHGIRVGTKPEELEEARRFYTEVLGLHTDPQRPNIPGIPGFWMYVGQDNRTTQIHLLGAIGRSPIARSDKEDPTLPHVALAVENIEETRQELERLGIWHWSIKGLAGPRSDQVFIQDAFGNVIELHQVGSCTCNKSALDGDQA